MSDFCTFRPFRSYVTGTSRMFSLDENLSFAMLILLRVREALNACSRERLGSFGMLLVLRSFVYVCIFKLPMLL